MAKRVTLRVLRQAELQATVLTGGPVSTVRELEMHVDSALVRTSYAPQFWRDVELYGLREAHAILLNHPEYYDAERMRELSSLVGRVLSAFGAGV
jgi:hypothetical protein